MNELDVNMSVERIVRGINEENFIIALKILKVSHGFTFRELARYMKVSPSLIYKVVKAGRYEGIMKEETLKTKIYYLKIGVDYALKYDPKFRK